MDAVKILVAFYSRGGVTEALAKTIDEGAQGEGADVRMRRVPDIVGPEIMAKAPGWRENSERMTQQYGTATTEDAEWADGIIFGTPTRFGNASAELKAYIDSMGGLWFRGALNGKVGSAFCSTSTKHGGNETTIVSLFYPMSHLGLIIVPTGYANPVMFAGGSPYGATSISGQNSTMPSADDLGAARFQGQRVAQVARALKAAASTGSK